MADAKITISATDLASDVFVKVKEKLQDVGAVANDSTPKVSAFSKVVQELTPHSQNAAGAFTSMKGTLGEAFENPTQKAQQLAGAIAGDLVGGLGAAGVAAGIAAGALAAVGLSAFKLAEHAAAIGGNLNDMSEKTGVSVEALSRLQNASKVAGTDLDTMGRALFMLQKGLGEDSEKVAGGLKKIGLTIEELKADGPDRYLALIAEHMKGTADPAAKAAAVMEIFGKAGKELLPTLNKLDEALALTGDIDPWTTQQAAAAEQFEMQMASLSEHVSAVGVALGRDLIPAAAATVDGLVWLGVRLQHIIDLGGLVSGTYHAVQGVLGETALAAETAGAKQDVINNAHRIGAPLTISYGDAVKYVNEKFAELHPSQDKATGAADAWIKKLSETAAAGIKAAAADAELTEGLARMGIVRGAGIEAANEYTATLKKEADEAKKRAEEQKKWTDLEADLAAASGTLRQRVDELDGSVREGIAYYLARGVEVDKLSKYYDVSKESIHAVTEQLKLEKLARDLASKMTQTYQDDAKNTNDVLYQQDELLRHGLTPQLTLASYAFESAGYTVHNFGTTIDLANISGKEFLKTLRDAGPVMSAVSSTMASIPQTIANALTGGGGMSGAAQAVGSTFGSNLGKNISTKLTQSLTEGGAKALSPMLGTLVSAIPVIGAAIGPLVGVAMDGLKRLFGGVSEEVKKARDSVATFEASIASNLTATQKAEAGGVAWKATVIGIRDAFIATGKSEADAMAAAEALWRSQAAGSAAAKAEIDKLNAVLNEQKQDAADLDAATKKYKFSIEELGPAMQKQQLSAQAAGLENDFRLLAGSGIDVKTVIDHMGSSINDFLHNAQKTGSEVPSEMKPILEKMVEMGTLTDSNGNKITDLGVSGITFSETMTQGFGKIVDKLTELINKIAGTTGALNALPASKTIDIIYNQRTTGDAPSGSRFGDGESFANEGFDLSRPTRAIVGDAQGDPESVLRASTVRDIVRAARAANAGRGPSGSAASSSDAALAALTAKFDAMQRTLTAQTQTFTAAMLRLPRLMTEAQQLA